MRNTVLVAASAAFLLTTTTFAVACSSSIVQPGMSITDRPIIVQAGKSCTIGMNLSGWEVHRISIVEPPKRGSMSINGTRSYTYSANKGAGQDQFVIEVETTGVDWYSGVKLQRTTWRITRPVEIR
jgi:hypothetical protein